MTPATSDASAVPDVVVRGTGANFVQQIETGQHRLVADEPASVGGTDTGPTPYDLLLAALGSCTAMTLGIYARRKNLPLEQVVVSLRHSRIHAADCANCETKMGKIDRIDLDLQLTGALTDEQRARLLQVADLCPVHRTLTSEIDIRTKMVG
jgi:putative redox protein